MRRRSGYNPKRELVALIEVTPELRTKLAVVDYRGNPEHKMHPNDYGLTPPTNPRAGKAICDQPEPLAKAEALAALREGARRLLVSRQTRNGWPQNIWAVIGGEAYEAQLENNELGTYHGYPMPAADPFRATVAAEWIARDDR